MTAGRRVKCGAWGLVLFLCMTAGPSAQQAPAHIAALDLRVAAADLVVRGTVSTVRRQDEGQLQRLHVTVRVVETIKGRPRATIEFIETGTMGPDFERFNEAYLNDWRTKGYD